ncbi:hypothetical protein [Streptomyces prunicolor]|uniref:Restriction endonuclease type IV Mrr domain-containing protein n=1 Tax=Streptomyces prunicolor TaxID=67348 RepID=A0ABU4FBD7_9ACTN|nr:hypothetical protein [Streptomyces prunicolor]MDV7217903.1 hypothetical protein [Streptomyces prunicolor]
MSWELALEYIKTLIWPVIVLTLGLTFKRQVGGLIGRLQSLETPVGSANFGEKADAVGQVAAEIGDEISSQLASMDSSEIGDGEKPEGNESSADSHSDRFDVDNDVEVRIRSLISREGPDPTSIVLNSWRAVEQAMSKSLRDSVGPNPPPGYLIKTVANQGLLSSQLIALVNDLFELRNQVVHGAGLMIAKADAESYQKAAANVIDALELAESPGYRAMAYEERVFRALRTLVGVSIERPFNNRTAGHDFLVTLGGGKIVAIETKYRVRQPLRAGDADEIFGNVRKQVRLKVGRDVPVLLITNAVLKPDIEKLNRERSGDVPSAEVIQWNGHEDNDYLLRALGRAMG